MYPERIGRTTLTTITSILFSAIAFSLENKEPIVVTVAVGELMQWQTAQDSDLVAFEICFPPYQEGRYENIKQE